MQGREDVEGGCKRTESEVEERWEGMRIQKV